MPTLALQQSKRDYEAGLFSVGGFLGFVQAVIDSGNYDHVLVLARRAYCVVRAAVEAGAIDTRECLVTNQRVLDFADRWHPARRVALLDEVVVTGASLVRVSKIARTYYPDRCDLLAYASIAQSNVDLKPVMGLEIDANRSVSASEAAEFSAEIADWMAATGYPYFVDFATFTATLPPSIHSPSDYWPTGQHFLTTDITNPHQRRNGVSSYSIRPTSGLVSEILPAQVATAVEDIRLRLLVREDPKTAEHHIWLVAKAVLAPQSATSLRRLIAPLLTSLGLPVPPEDFPRRRARTRFRWAQQLVGFLFFQELLASKRVPSLLSSDLTLDIKSWGIQCSPEVGQKVAMLAQLESSESRTLQRTIQAWQPDQLLTIDRIGSGNHYARELDDRLHHSDPSASELAQLIALAAGAHHRFVPPEEFAISTGLLASELKQLLKRLKCDQAGFGLAIDRLNESHAIVPAAIDFHHDGVLYAARGYRHGENSHLMRSATFFAKSLDDSRTSRSELDLIIDHAGLGLSALVPSSTRFTDAVSLLESIGDDRNEPVPAPPELESRHRGALAKFSHVLLPNIVDLRNDIHANAIKAAEGLDVDAGHIERVRLAAEQLLTASAEAPLDEIGKAMKRLAGWLNDWDRVVRAALESGPVIDDLERVFLPTSTSEAETSLFEFLGLEPGLIPKLFEAGRVKR